MPKTTQHNGRRALDRWAKDCGWADFDVYLQAGGTLLGARTDLLEQRARLDAALAALPGGHEFALKIADVEEKPAEPVIGPEALARLEAEQDGEESAAQGAEA